jgi:hypothetical protein
MMNKRYNIILVVVTIVIIGLITLFFCFKNEKVNILTRYKPKTKEIYKMRYFIRNGDTIIQGKPRPLGYVQRSIARICNPCPQQYKKLQMLCL